MIWKASPRFFAKAGSAAIELGRRPRGHRSARSAATEQRAGLAAVNALQHLEADRLIGRQQVSRLPADQTRPRRPRPDRIADMRDANGRLGSCASWP